MLRLALMIYSFVGTTLAGSFVIAALVSGHDTLKPIVGAAALGFALAVPVALYVAREMMKGRG